MKDKNSPSNCRLLLSSSYILQHSSFHFLFSFLFISPKDLHTYIHTEIGKYSAHYNNSLHTCCVVSIRVWSPLALLLRLELATLFSLSGCLWQSPNLSISTPDMPSFPSCFLVAPHPPWYHHLGKVSCRHTPFALRHAADHLNPFGARATIN